MRRYKRRVTNRLKTITTILVLALITTAIWIGLSKMLDSGRNAVKTSSNSTTVAESSASSGEIDEVPEENPVADPMPVEMTDPEKLKSSWTEESTFGGNKAFSEYAIDNTFANGLNMKSWIFRNNMPLKEFRTTKKK